MNLDEPNKPVNCGKRLRQIAMNDFNFEPTRLVMLDDLQIRKLPASVVTRGTLSNVINGKPVKFSTAQDYAERSEISVGQLLRWDTKCLVRCEEYLSGLKEAIHKLDFQVHQLENAGSLSLSEQRNLAMSIVNGLREPQNSRWQSRHGIEETQWYVQPLADLVHETDHSIVKEKLGQLIRKGVEGLSGGRHRLVVGIEPAEKFARHLPTNQGRTTSELFADQTLFKLTCDFIAVLESQVMKACDPLLEVLRTHRF